MGHPGAEAPVPFNQFWCHPGSAMAIAAPAATGCPRTLCQHRDNRRLGKTWRSPHPGADGPKMSFSILGVLQSGAVTLPKHQGSAVREPEAALPEPSQTPAEQRWLWGQCMMRATVCQCHGHGHSTPWGLHAQGPRRSQGIWARWHLWHSRRKGADSIIVTGWCQVYPV